ncbi:MAG: Mur ligase domain-containing protein, partial [Planctomycetota bacterium]|nr:Mur ligase domain-containing protein [Planctomycetota bacterium]
MPSPSVPPRSYASNCPPGSGRDPFQDRRIHLLGIGGSGMSGLARIMVDRGARASGVDAVESDVVAGLRASGIAIVAGDEAT